MWGKDLTKSPFQIPERAIKVIRDYVAALRFPFLRGPSLKLKQIGTLLAQMPFLCSVVAYESELSTLRSITKKSHNQRLRDLLRFVTRLGFEPKTHSLEGCCSIQLSYRADP